MELDGVVRNVAGRVERVTAGPWRRGGSSGRPGRSSAPRFALRPEGSEAVAIGVAVAEHPGLVTIRTLVGSERIVEMLVGEQLPRIR